MPWQLSSFCISEEKTGGSWWGSFGAFVAIGSKLIESLALHISLRWADSNVTWRRDQSISKLLAYSGSRSFNRRLLLLFALSDRHLFPVLCFTSMTISADDGLNENVYIPGLHINFLHTKLLNKGQWPKIKQRNNSRNSACSMSSPVDAVILFHWAGWCWGSEARCRWDWLRLNV